MAEELTTELIDDLDPEELMDALALLDDYGIEDEGVQTVEDAQSKLRQHLKKMQEVQSSGGISVESIGDLDPDDIEAAMILLENLKLDTAVGSVAEAQVVLRQHLKSLQEETVQIEVLKTIKIVL